jgi:hypothetical protein
MKKALVLGIGNELLCDDGIGLRVVDCAAIESCNGFGDGRKNGLCNAGRDRDFWN